MLESTRGKCETQKQAGTAAVTAAAVAGAVVLQSASRALWTQLPHQWASEPRWVGAGRPFTLLRRVGLAMGGAG